MKAINHSLRIHFFRDSINSRNTNYLNIHCYFILKTLSLQSSDHLTFSYKFGTFMKLDEFMDFRERLNNSLHYLYVAIERIMQNLMVAPSIENLFTLDVLPKDNCINWDALR